jgi:hypothetical protein
MTKPGGSAPDQVKESDDTKPPLRTPPPPPHPRITLTQSTNELGDSKEYPSSKPSTPNSDSDELLTANWAWGWPSYTCLRGT